jgi:hypothetical protein
MPGTPKLDSKRPGRFAVEKGATFWTVEHEPMDPAVRELIQSGNRKRVEKILETLRDGAVNGIKATLIGSNEDDELAGLAGKGTGNTRRRRNRAPVREVPFDEAARG